MGLWCNDDHMNAFAHMGPRYNGTRLYDACIWTDIRALNISEQYNNSSCTDMHGTRTWQPCTCRCPGTQVLWWRHQMETFSASLAIVRESNDHRWIPLIGPVTRSFGVSFNQRLSKQSRRRWFETPSPSLWRHSNAFSEVCITNGDFESPSFFRWRHI